MRDNQSAIWKMYIFLLILVSSFVVVLHFFRRHAVFSIRARDVQLTQYKRYYALLNFWLEAHAYGRSLNKLLQNRGVKSVVIHGAGELGRRVYEELNSGDIHVIGISDQLGPWIEPIIPHQSNELLENVNKLPEADLYIVTPFHFFDVILRNYPPEIPRERIVSLERLILELFNDEDDLPVRS